MQRSSVYTWALNCLEYFDCRVYAPTSVIEFKKILPKLTGDFILILKHQSAVKWKEWLDYCQIINREETCVIIDESQVFRSRKSIIGKFGLWVSMNARTTYLLSGDPISNDYEGLYNQFRMLGDYGLTIKSFTEQFLVIEYKEIRGIDWKIPKVIGHKNEDQLVEKMRSMAVLMKKEEVIELPPQVWQDIYLDMEPICRREYKNIKREQVIVNKYPLETMGQKFVAARNIASGFYKATKEYNEEIVKLSNHKLDAVKDLLESTPDDFIIFYTFIEEKRELLALCKKIGIKTFEFNGQDLSGHERHKYKGRKVLLNQYTTGSRGLNLQDIRRTIYYSPTLSGELYKQSIDRTHRMGQEYTCWYYRLITNNTIERKIYDTLEKAQDYTKKLFEKEEFKMDSQHEMDNYWDEIEQSGPVILKCKELISDMIECLPSFIPNGKLRIYNKHGESFWLNFKKHTVTFEGGTVDIEDKTLDNCIIYMDHADEFLSILLDKYCLPEVFQMFTVLQHGQYPEDVIKHLGYIKDMILWRIVTESLDSKHILPLFHKMHEEDMQIKEALKEKEEL